MSRWLIVTYLRDTTDMNLVGPALRSKHEYALKNKYGYIMVHTTPPQIMCTGYTHIWISSPDSMILNPDLPLDVILGNKHLITGHNYDNLLFVNSDDGWAAFRSPLSAPSTPHFSPHTEYTSGNFVATFLGVKQQAVIDAFLKSLNELKVKGLESKESKVSIHTKWRWMDEGKTETGYLEFLPDGKAMNTWGPATWSENKDGSYTLTQGACTHMIYLSEDRDSLTILRQDGYFATGIPFDKVVPVQPDIPIGGYLDLMKRCAS